MNYEIDANDLVQRLTKRIGDLEFDVVVRDQKIAWLTEQLKDMKEKMQAEN